MTGLLLVFNTPFWNALISAFLFSIPLGFTISVMLFLLLKIVPAEYSQCRYVLCVGSLTLLCLGVLLGQSYWEGTQPQVSMPLMQETDAAFSSQPEGRDFGAQQRHTQTDIPFPWRQWAALIWVCGVFFMLLGTVGEVHSGSGILRNSFAVTNPEILALLEDIKQKLAIKGEVLLSSGKHITMAGVIGVFEHTVLLPLSFLTQIPRDQLASILAHELAHIKRHDYIVNLFQMIVESLLFFNPAVWWIGGRIRAEREACCDQLALNAVPDRDRYASALAAAAESAWLVRNESPAIQALGGHGRPSSLKDRVLRLLKPGYRPFLKLPLPGMVLTMALAFLAIGTGWGVTHKVGHQLSEEHERLDPAALEARLRSQNRIMVRATIETEDDNQQTWLYLAVTTYYYPGGSNKAMDYLWGSNGERALEVETVAGEFWVAAWGQGYAPQVLGPFHPGAHFNDDFRFVLKRGFTSFLRIVDSSGAVLPNCQVGAAYDFKGLGGVGTSPVEEGDVWRIEGCIEKPMGLVFYCDGYYRETTEILLQPDEVHEIVLEKIGLFHGRVIDERGNPLDNVEIRNEPRVGHGPELKFRHTEVGKTDELGFFSIGRINVRGDGGEIGPFRFAYSLNRNIPARFVFYKRGYFPTLGEVYPGKPVSIRMTPNLLKARLLDMNSGQPIQRANIYLVETSAIRIDDSYSPERYRESQGGISVGLTDKEGKIYTPRMSHIHRPGSFNWDRVFPFSNPGVYYLVARKAGYRDLKFWERSDQPSKDVFMVPLDRTQETMAPMESDRTGASAIPEKLVFRFKIPREGSRPRGRIKATIQVPGRTEETTFSLDQAKQRTHDPSQFEISFEKTTPCTVWLEPLDLPNYWFNSVEHFSTSAETDFHVFEIALHTAGTLNFNITVSNEREPESVDVGFLAYENEEPGEHLAWRSLYMLSPNNRYRGSFQEKLPLNRAFRAMAKMGHTVVMSEPMMCTKQEPVLHADFHFESGVSAYGRVMMPDGTPPPQYSLAVDHPFADKFRILVSVGDDGSFKVEHLNPKYHPDFFFRKDRKWFRDYILSNPKTPIVFDREMLIELDRSPR